jgi:1-acyl-sn-glycerol-3-phosphate acyltransferase
LDLINHPFFFLCPSCFSENTLQNSQCSSCGIKINIGNDCVVFGDQKINFGNYYQLIETKLPVKQVSVEPFSEIYLEDKKGILRTSQKAFLRQGIQRLNFRGYHHLYERVIERPVDIGKGFLIILENHIEFISELERMSWSREEFSCVTTNGHYFVFKIKHQPFYQIKFLHESPLKYEIIFRKWLDSFYQNSTPKKIIEYQPRLIFSTPHQSGLILDFSANQQKEKNYIFEKICITILEFIVRIFLRFWIKAKIFSKENWEIVKHGFTILNHQSALDPFIVGAFLDRKIAFLTKSTSFTHRVARFFLKWLMGIPTTRYETDPQVIYFIHKFISNGIRVGIFPEGERSWGGRMGSFKLSLVKLLMASREAITPIVLQNAFHFWPRWSNLPRRTEVQITIGAPFCLIPEIYSVDEQRTFLEEYFKTQLKEN